MLDLLSFSFPMMKMQEGGTQMFLNQRKVVTRITVQKQDVENIH